MEQADIARLKAQFDDIDAQIDAADLDERASRALPTKTCPTPVGNWNGSRPGPGPVASWGRDTSGFHSVGEYLGAVKNASGGSIDQRLLNAVTTYGGEAHRPGRWLRRADRVEADHRRAGARQGHAHRLPPPARHPEQHGDDPRGRGHGALRVGHHRDLDARGRDHHGIEARCSSR